MKHIDNNHRADSNDIAVIGVACRLPGEVNSSEAFHEFLIKGGNGIGPIPQDRWDKLGFYHADNDIHGKMYVQQGGFISGLADFDAGFFGISPKEAPYLDPQHRWLLETSYEAIENAGQNLDELRGSETGVFMGQFMHDFEQLQLDSNAHDLITSHSSTGSSMTLTANRVSYSFDFKGPSLTLDTACSSSLVALDLACKSLLNKDCDMALAGGVNLLLRPELTMSICKASMLSPDGLCKSFDASANGYVRSEGVACVVVKRLADARKDGDHILAVIKSSGSNQDGQTSGITVPNGLSQQKLLKKTLSAAGLSGADIDYAEAHGTGTAVGDPIEVNALGKVLGQSKGRDKNEPCLIGSVKSNIGHTEPTAGIAGLIKTINAMNYGVIPKNIHCNEVNPAIQTNVLNIDIVRENTPWPVKAGKPKRAIVNSFGFGGTNANVVLESVEQHDNTPAPLQPVKHLFISAKSEGALKGLAQAHIEKLALLNEQDIQDYCINSAKNRSHFRHRLVVPGKDRSDLIAALTGWLENDPKSSVVSGTSKFKDDEPIAFVFSGMGTTWKGMCKQLYTEDPIFQGVIDQVDAQLQQYVDWSLSDIMFANDNDNIHETHYAQPAIFATQVGLYESLKARGVIPEAIVGHSAGEVAAAYCAGVYSFPDAVKIIYHRSQLQQTTSGLGAMLAVGLSEQDALSYCADILDTVSIAAVNSDEAVTLSGDKAQLQKLYEKLDSEGVFAKFLNVDVPYHSPIMDQLKQPLIDALISLDHCPESIDLYSTVTGELSTDDLWTGAYWADNVRDPVYFSKAIRNMLSDGFSCFLEIAPHSVLSHSINTLSADERGAVAHTLKRNNHELSSIEEGLATLYCSGVMLPWQRALQSNNQVKLPSYVWQRSHYWVEHEDVSNARLYGKQKQDAFYDEHIPFLGSQLISQAPVWQCRIDLNELTELRGHQVDGEVIYPGAGYIEGMLQAAQSDKLNGRVLALHDIQFLRPLYLEEGHNLKLETRWDSGKGVYQVFALEQEAWHLQSTAKIAQYRPKTLHEIDIESYKKSADKVYNKDDFYRHCHQIGMEYKDRFQAITQVWKGKGYALAKIEVDEIHGVLPPILLDGAFQVFFSSVDIAYLPIAIESLILHAPVTKRMYSYLTVKEQQENAYIGDILILNEVGQQCVEMRGVHLKMQSPQQYDELLEPSLKYQYQWQSIAFEHVEDVATSILSAGFEETLCDETCTVIGHIDLRSTSQAFAEKCQVHSEYLERIIIDCRKINVLTEVEVIDNAVLTDSSVVLLFLQTIQAVAWKKPLDVVLLTEYAWPVNSAVKVKPLQSALWGLVRVFASENPQFKVTMLDIHDNDLPLNRLLVGDFIEPEMAVKEGCWYAHKLLPLEDSSCVKSQSSEILPDTTEQVSYGLKGSGWLASAMPSLRCDTQKSVSHIACQGGIPVAEQALLYLCYVDSQYNLSLSSEGICSSLNTAELSIELNSEQTEFALAYLNDIHGFLSAFEPIQRLKPKAILFVEPSNTVDFALLDYAQQVGVQCFVEAEPTGTENDTGIVYVNRSDISKLNVDLVVYCLERPLAVSLTEQLTHGVDFITLFEGQVAAEQASRLTLHRLNLKRLAKYAHTDFIELMQVALKCLMKLVDLYPSAYEASIAASALPKNIQESQFTHARYAIDMSKKPAYLEKQFDYSGNMKGKSYLVTGGQGGIGLVVVQWLIQNNASAIYVTGRSALKGSLQTLIESAEKVGTKVYYLQADVASYDDMRETVAHIIHQPESFSGLFHSAGVLADATFAQQNVEGFQKVLAPKLQGSWYLHQLTREVELDYFVCFSSIAAVVGWPGQANYAFANAFMDGLCHMRRNQGLSATAINWGPWADAGMAAELEEQEIARMQSAGMQGISTEQGLSDMSKVMNSSIAQAGVFIQDWQKMAELGLSARLLKVFSNLVDVDDTKTSDIKATLSQMNAEQRLPVLLTEVRNALAAALGMGTGEQLDEHTSVFDYGLNSLMAVEFKNRIQPLIDHPLPASMVTKQGSITKIALFLETLYGNDEAQITEVDETQSFKVTI
ncbi:hypothetical protein CWB96_19935 [Pseudoalteromonas citrea]|uniref:Uncharacterized protein n=1 Tax=Pseudoalteromonas citrea TaxID=43655 RepID=A0A5S3XJ84_9GAMM|nr:type I polyketide synthase [Pseudoalteromonas citrea]TMP47148.1 hypothetical protein CWB97_00455 [Pseudoalteromonas citrea]TMP54103.1 hypothetical protein CWB96_19935 [Pseudoalteromonas citrea]